jgi:ribosome-binding protein aMBF1 (putative translation factor)
MRTQRKKIIKKQSRIKTRIKKFDSQAIQYLYDRYVGASKNRQEDFEDVVLSAQIARQIYTLRTQMGISQRELAKRVGTSASVICRLEDADYNGHSLFMLKRIAKAVNQKIDIHFVPAHTKLKAA